MAVQTVFKRYELKYLLTLAQKETVLRAMEPYMTLDKYGKTTIRNLYYDTDTYLLIRRSIEKPAYKEKLRLRSYSRVDSDSTAFVELKKKYKSVVYKRRISLPYGEATAWLSRQMHTKKHTQIASEIDYFLDYYGSLHPTVFLSYEREAFYSNDGSDFRVTFDFDIVSRRHDLSLESGRFGEPLLPPDKMIVEVKFAGAVPYWFVQIMNEFGLSFHTFSKIGTDLKKNVLKNNGIEEFLLTGFM